MRIYRRKPIRLPVSMEAHTLGSSDRRGNKYGMRSRHFCSTQWKLSVAWLVYELENKGIECDMHVPCTSRKPAESRSLLFAGSLPCSELILCLVSEQQSTASSCSLARCRQRPRPWTQLRSTKQQRSRLVSTVEARSSCRPRPRTAYRQPPTTAGACRELSRGQHRNTASSACPHRLYEVKDP